MNKFWTGVGSRETPIEILEVMSKIALKLVEGGWTLRSGGAAGADLAFESGVRSYFVDTTPDIYIPWSGFSDCYSDQGYKCLKDFPKEIQSKASEIASNIHPAWNHLTSGGRALHTRNVFQVLGDSLDSPSRFLICWAATDKLGVPKGGTRTAWVLAKSYEIPCYNLFNQADYDRITNWLFKE